MQKPLNLWLYSPAAERKSSVPNFLHGKWELQVSGSATLQHVRVELTVWLEYERLRLGVSTVRTLCLLSHHLYYVVEECACLTARCVVRSLVKTYAPVCVPVGVHYVCSTMLLCTFHWCVTG